MELSKEIIKQAYLLLKNNAYHENLNFFLKNRVAKFECNNYDGAIETLHQILNSNAPSEHQAFQEWIRQINFHVIPKSIIRPEEQQQNEYNRNAKGLFLSNITESSKYQLQQVNYFINAPVELHILDVIWCLVVGPILEEELNKDCYGNRLHETAKYLFQKSKQDQPAGSAEIFKRYIDQYSAWRDNAINCAITLSEKGDDVALLSLDLKSYFYHINIDFDKINEHINNSSIDENIKNCGLVITKLIQIIINHYSEVIKISLSITHPDCDNKVGLPIGFASSSILSNWYLTQFDNDISDIARPAYYGRYVDDILIVFKRPKIDLAQPIESLIKFYLKDLLHESNTGYEIVVGIHNIPIQRDKLILQFFDKHHSQASLKLFKKEIEERSSAFKFLPTDHIDKELDKFAYDILYDGSSNKLRSIVGLSENETELSSFLSSHIIAHRLCKIDKKDVVLPQLKVFFRGANILRFSRLWEKVYQYGVILNRPEFVVEFYRSIQNEISKIEFIDNSGSKIDDITKKVKLDLELYNNLSLSICLGLLDISSFERLSNQELIELVIKDPIDFLDKLLDGTLELFDGVEALTGLQRFSYHLDINQFVRNFRHSNLIRHNLVAWPLANYTAYTGDLTDESSFRTDEINELDQAKVSCSPRFIHFDEWQIFHLKKALSDKELLNNWQSSSIDSYKKLAYWSEFPVEFTELSQRNNNTVTISTLTAGTPSIKRKSVLRVALANLQVEKSNIEVAIRKDKKPNVSLERQAKLYQILNEAVREESDLLVIPELAIPVSWLPFMISHARKHQIGLVFGLEHWVINDIAYNLLVEALPFKVAGKYKSSVMTARLKNHYAPAELDMLESFRLNPATQSLESFNYHKVHWNDICFAAYNCFELSDIEHRTIFRSEIDLLIACVWNKDTNYYQHILESAVRDLHCYVIQANTSQYGGSCVLCPTNTESKTMLFVKGGKNSCVLTTEINISALRDFQFKSKSGAKDFFKPLPPGYKSEEVLKR